MSIKCGFFNSLDHDRVYDAVDMGSLFDGIITDGVFDNYGDIFATSPGTGMQVVVKPGRAWFNSTWTVNDAPVALSIAAPDVSLSRIDAVVLEINHTVAVRDNVLKIIKGTPAVTPAKPALSNANDIYQHPLAYVTVAPGTNAITASMIDIRVGKSDCPFVTSVLESVSIDALFAKWENDFTTWFEDIQAQLSGDVAANLQNQINELDKRVDDLDNRLELIQKDKAGIRIILKTASGRFLSGVRVDGLTTLEGSEVYTNTAGEAYGYVNEGTVTLSVSGYADIENISNTYTVYKGYIYEYEWTATVVNFRKWVSSFNTKFSPNVQRVDVTSVGGGGGGVDCRNRPTNAKSKSTHYGGGGGYCAVQENVLFSPNTDYAGIVAAGQQADASSAGATSSTAVQAGSSSFLGVVGQGGWCHKYYDPGTTDQGAIGNGNGGLPGGNGQDGSVYGYASFTETVLYGGGGGGGGAIQWDFDYERWIKYNAGSGGKSGGGNGAFPNLVRDETETRVDGTPGKDGFGGGGGGGSTTNDSYGSAEGRSAKGGSGCVAIRMHLTITG